MPAAPRPLCMQGLYNKFKNLIDTPELRIHILSLLFGRSYSNPMCSRAKIPKLWIHQ